MEGPALRAFLRAFHERYPGVTASSMGFLTDASGKSSYRIVAEEALEGVEEPRVLDLGCGDGILLAEFDRYSPGVTLAGMDLVPSEIDLAKALVPNATLVCGDITKPFPFFDAAFNVVTAHLVMMLLGPIDKTLDQVSRVLAPDGRFVFVVDDFGDDAKVFTRLMGVAINAMGAPVPTFAERSPADPRIYESRKLAALLEQHEFFDFREKRVLLRGALNSESAWGLLRGTYPLGVFEVSKRELARRAVSEEVALMSESEVVLPLKVIAVNRAR